MTAAFFIILISLSTALLVVLGVCAILKKDEESYLGDLNSLRSDNHVKEQK